MFVLNDVITFRANETNKSLLLLLRARIFYSQLEYEASINDFQAALVNGSLPDEQLYQEMEQVYSCFEKNDKRRYSSFVLEIDESTSFTAIQVKYKQLCLKFHPDRCQNSLEKARHEVEFKRLGNAYNYILEQLLERGGQSRPLTEPS